MTKVLLSNDRRNLDRLSIVCQAFGRLSNASQGHEGSPSACSTQRLPFRAPPHHLMPPLSSYLALSAASKHQSVMNVIAVKATTPVSCFESRMNVKRIVRPVDCLFPVSNRCDFADTITL